jgi:hypothetical protein
MGISRIVGSAVGIHHGAQAKESGCLLAVDGARATSPCPIAAFVTLPLSSASSYAIFFIEQETTASL